MDDKAAVIDMLLTLRTSMRFVNFRGGLTGKLNADGSLNANVADGLGSPYIWVRFGNDRAASAVRSLKIRNAPGVDVIVAFDMLIGEDVVLEVNPARASEVLGEAAAAFNVPLVPESMLTPISGRDVMPGAVMVAEGGGLIVKIMPTWIPGGAWWDGSARITLTPTATTGKKSLCVIGIDLATEAAVVTLAADRGLGETLIADGKPTAAGAADIKAVTDADPAVFWVGAVELENGATSINGAKIVDRRLWAWALPGASLDVSDGVTTVIGATAIEFTSGATVTDNAGVAEVAITGGGGSNPAPSQWVNSTSENKSGTSYSAYTNSAEGTFTAPPTGKIYVTVSARIQIGNTVNYGFTSWELREGSSIGSGTVVTAADDNRAIRAGDTVTASAPFYAQGSHRYLVTGLTPGDTYNIRTMHRSSTTVTSDFRSLLVEPVL